VAYNLPTFNLTCNIWHNKGSTTTVFPVVAPPNVTCLCQLRYMRTAAALGSGSTGSWGMLLLVPKGTDVRARRPGGVNPDLVEAPAGSGRYYICSQTDDIAKGFANEHRAVALAGNIQAANAWPQPLP
jgi:hypothetical protein